MNREIKFRLRFKGKFVGYEKWERREWLYSKDNISWSNEEILHDDKDQFTGLSDKNGKEIYEGDIVKLSFSDKYRAEVYWGKEGLWCLKWNTEGKAYNYRMFAISSDFEIIGNVFENPEQRKEEK